MEGAPVVTKTKPTTADPKALPFTGPVGWITADMLEALRTEHSELTRDELVTIAEEASWIMNQLTDNRFHGVSYWSDEYELIDCKFKIARSPLRSIEKVEQIHDVCGSRTREEINWCLIGPGTISVCGCGDKSDYRTNFGGGCGCRKRIRVEYSLKDNIPPGGRSAAFNLASEYAKAKTGKKCALPERVTSISRQGVSWTILDPQDFMDKGLTGLGRIDHWLNVAKRSTSGKIIDPLLGKRISSERLSSGPFGAPFDEGFDEGFDTL